MVSRMPTQAEAKTDAIKAAIEPLWNAKKELRQERDGLTLILESPPSWISGKNEERIGFHVRVRLFKGKEEVRIDPDRCFVNPPTQVVVSRAERDADGNETKPRVLSYDPEAAFWEVLWQSVTNVPGVTT